MKAIFPILFICLSLLAGCADPDEPLPSNQIDERLLFLRKVLKGPLSTPEGKLKSESFFSGPNTLQYRTDFYYDPKGKEVLKVTVQNGDTIAIYVNEYLENGKLDQTGVYTSESDGYVFAHYFKRFYENNGQIINVIKGRDGNFSEHEQFKFDQQGRKISYRRGNQSTFSLHRFIYENEQSNKIYEEHYLEPEQNEPLYRYLYNYDEAGLLQAKLISFPITNGDRAEFEYFYDEKGRISEELKNDLRFLSGAIERRTFEYY